MTRTLSKVFVAALVGSLTSPLQAQAIRQKPLPNLPAGGSGVTDLQMLVPGFSVRPLPLELRNVNAVRYREDGKLVALTFDGRVFLLSDTDGDGLEDKADLFYDPGRLYLSLNIALTPPDYPGGRGVFIARKGNLALQLDTNGDDKADKDVIVADKWENPRRFPGGASDTIGVALDREGNVYFGLGAANSQNGYLLENGVASYQITSERGALLKMPPDFSRREIVATGIRAAFGLAFNAAGDLFASDQEGATWMPNGNPFDELLHVEPGRHYGFPPRHPKHLPNVIDEPSVVDFGPQHQSTCGLFFNEPVQGGPVFGPEWWRGDAFVAGEARGKLYRTKLVNTPSGYVGQNQIVAALGWLTIDQCVSPRGELVVTVHSGPPDWGTGALGTGKLFKVTRTDPDAAQPVLTYALRPDERRITFDRALPPGIESDLAARTKITAGVYVREGDRFETFRPGYRAVDQQQSAPRTKVAVKAARVSEDRRTLIFTTESHVAAEHAAIDIDEWPCGAAAPAGARPQKSVIAVAADASGVEAQWTSADGRDSWRGWLPHFDLQVARELTAPSAEHAGLWQRLARPGTLVLRGQLDLWSMLRPAVQPGERLDFTLPAERVTVSFASSAGAAPRLKVLGGTNAAPETISDGDVARLMRHTARERSWVPVELTLSTGREGRAPTLHVSWTTAEDNRPRAFALRRVLMPWAAPAPLAIAPKTPPELAGGDWHRGKQLFAACAMCHGLNSEGSRVGPDLSNLVYRDYASVLKDIAEPNAAINPDHVAYAITLNNGETRTSVVLEDNADHVLLAVPAGAPQKLAKREIASMAASPVSLMPPAMDQALGAQGLKDLLTFLMQPRPQEPQTSQSAQPSTP
jgi:putative heme-binding domain-containing protein